MLLVNAEHLALTAFTSASPNAVIDDYHIPEQACAF